MLVLNVNLHGEFTHLRTMREEQGGTPSVLERKKKLRKPNMGLSPICFFTTKIFLFRQVEHGTAHLIHRGKGMGRVTFSWSCFGLWPP